MIVVCALACGGGLLGCGGRAASEVKADPVVEKPKPPSAVPMWLGNGERNFYGTGPWKDGELTVIWEVETGFISGRLHKDPWGGTSWPGQPSIKDNRVYFPSADGNVYCLDKDDGSVIWKFKGKDSFKATPAIFGDKIIASGLDHSIYCINANDGTLIWEYKTGFEIDGSTVLVGDRLYFGAEDRNFYCLNFTDGSLIYKVPVGSVEGNITMKDGRAYFSTEQGDLYCVDPADGRTIWKTRIGADSDSTPAVVNGLVYTAAEDGVVRAYKQDTRRIGLAVRDGRRSRWSRQREKRNLGESDLLQRPHLHRSGQSLSLLPDRRQRRTRLEIQSARQHLGHVAGGRRSRHLWRQSRLDAHGRFRYRHTDFRTEDWRQHQLHAGDPRWPHLHRRVQWEAALFGNGTEDGRSQRSEIRRQRSEVRGQTSEVSHQTSEVRDQTSEVRDQKPDVRS